MSLEGKITGEVDQISLSSEDVDAVHTSVVEDLTTGHEQALLSVVAPQIDGLPADVAADVLARVDESITPEQRRALLSVGKVLDSIRGIAQRAAASFIV